MAPAKAKAKGLPCPPKPLKPYPPTLNGKFDKAGDSQHYWGFPEDLILSQEQWCPDLSYYLIATTGFQNQRRKT